MYRLISCVAIAIALALWAAPSNRGTIRFEEIAARSGLRFVTENSPTPNKNQIETMVAGVALLDYDGDGYLDVYLVNGAAIPSLKKESPAYWNRLFHNNHDGTFTDVTEKAGVAGAGYGMGVAVGDYDNDGWPDLFVANVTGNQLFHNNGDGTFTEVTAESGRRRSAHGRRRRCGRSAPAGSTITTTACWIFRGELLQVGGESGSVLRAARPASAPTAIPSSMLRCTTRSIATTVTARSPMFPRKRESRRTWARA